jgi:hypothetical protein
MVTTVHYSIEFLLDFFIAEPELLHLRLKVPAFILELSLACFKVPDKILLGRLGFLVFVRAGLALRVSLLV